MKRQRGFTLVEILVAMAVVAIALAALVSAGGQSTSNVSAFRDRTYAQWVASNAMTELRLDPELREETERDGEELMMNQRWEWEAEVVDTADPNLLRIDVRVFMPGQENSIVTLTGFKGTSPDPQRKASSP
ncbi:MAG: type II secretion system minor pseudopilin GspI [Gammaproteobacteria bacterium]|nr:type II secretion system minor pseudopilin GspI [Gammaproteobacteria bacterium]